MDLKELSRTFGLFNLPEVNIISISQSWNTNMVAIDGATPEYESTGCRLCRSRN